MGEVSVVIARSEAGYPPAAGEQSHGHCEAADSSRGNLAFLFLIVLLTLLIFAVSINNPSFNPLSAKEVKKETCPHKGACLACHKKITADVVNEWKRSKHGMKGITCSACHSNPIKNNSIDPASCGKCHKEIAEKFKYGKHGFTMLAAKNIFKKTPGREEMEGNCGTCHSLYAEGKCQSCHKAHEFEVPDAKDEASCLKCHSKFEEKNHP